MESAAPPQDNPAREASRVGGRIVAVRTLLGGGVDGNEQLTAMVGAILIVLLAALGVTILRIGQLMWLHLFLGVLLLGPVLLKLASVGYRFARYYVRTAIYVAKGPPALALRAMGPALVALTVLVFASGVVLLFDGPRNQATLATVHKASFVLWLALFGLHLLAHVPRLPLSLRAVRLGNSEEPLSAGVAGGAAGRWIALAGALVGGAVLALVLVPHFSPWTAPGAFLQHHEH